MLPKGNIINSEIRDNNTTQVTTEVGFTNRLHTQKLNRLYLFKEKLYFSHATTACLADRV
jgi:hypothetical protein